MGLAVRGGARRRGSVPGLVDDLALAAAYARCRGGLILLLQPALATVWGALIFGEKLEPSQIVGVLITLGAVYLGSVTT